MNRGDSVLHLLLHPLTQPLLDHALVVQVAAARDALDAGEHSRIKTKRDGGGLPDIRAMHRGLHQPDIELVLRPETPLGFLIFKVGNITPRPHQFKDWGGCGGRG